MPRAFARIVVSERDGANVEGPLAPGDELVRVERVDAAGREPRFRVVRRRGGDDLAVEVSGATLIVGTMARGVIAPNQTNEFVLSRAMGSLRLRRWRVKGDNLDEGVDAGRKRRRAGRKLDRGWNVEGVEPRWTDDWVVWGVPPLPTAGEVLEHEGRVLFQSASVAAARADLLDRRTYWAKRLDNCTEHDWRIIETPSGFVSLRARHSVKRLGVANAYAYHDILTSYVTSVARGNAALTSQAVAAAHVDTGNEALAIATQLSEQVPVFEVSLAGAMRLSEECLRADERGQPWQPPA